MSEKLRELAMRLQQNKTSQNIPQKKSQEIKETPKEETPQEIGGYEEEQEEVEKAEMKPLKQETPKEESPQEQSKEDQVAMEIELLQNSGRFRVELLHQLIEINRALKVVAGVLVELTDDGKEENQKG